MDEQSKRIAEQAAAYFVQQRNENETAARRQEREAWLAEDARHVRAYEEAQRMWDRIGARRNDPTLQALKAADLAALDRPRQFSVNGLLLAAAVLVLLLSGAYLIVRFTAIPPPVSYATQLGERRTEILADGTHVVLNTDSAVEVQYTRSRREIALQRGEAQFEVTHDAARPFVVDTGMGTVTALGTRFQVRREQDAAVVTLLKGAVEVAEGEARRTLRPNEQARLSADAGIHVGTIDPAQVSGWLDGWLHFRNTPLGQVVAEANRYSPRKLRLGDPRLADLVLNGNFHTGDSPSIAFAVEQILPVRVDDSGPDIVLRPK
jgi:transmembrane sensor